MQQNTPEWEKLRQGKIGASDANIIMGVSTFMTPLDLYLKKKGLPPRKKESDNEFITSKGHWLEDKMRAEIELETGCEFPPEIRIHAEIDFLMASMDGYNEPWKMGIECKYVGQEDFAKIEKWDPQSSEPFPLPQFYPQMQQQYVCSGAVKMAVVAITEIVEMEEIDGVFVPKRLINPDKKGDKGTLIYVLNEYDKKTYKKVLKHVPLDMEYINKSLLPAVINFQKNHIEKNIEPVASDADIIDIKNLDVGKKVTEYKKNQEKIIVLKSKLKPLESTAKKLKEQIFKYELVNAPRMTCKGVSITQLTKEGDTDWGSAFEAIKENLGGVIFSLDTYESIAEIKTNLEAVMNMQLENFKKANTITYKIKVPDPKKTKKEPKEPAKTGVDNIEIKPTELVTIVPEVIITLDESPTEPEKTPVQIQKSLTNKQKDWDNMSPEEQATTAKANNFKTAGGKTPRGWAGKNVSERIDYLKKYAKRKDTPEDSKTDALNLVSHLAVIKYTS